MKDYKDREKDQLEGVAGGLGDPRGDENVA